MAVLKDLIVNGNSFFSGDVQCSGDLIVSGTTFNYAGMEAAGGGTDRVVWFSWANQNGTPVYDTTFVYNPSTKVLKINGNAVLTG